MQKISLAVLMALLVVSTSIRASESNPSSAPDGTGGKGSSVRKMKQDEGKSPPTNLAHGFNPDSGAGKNGIGASAQPLGVQAVSPVAPRPSVSEVMREISPLTDKQIVELRQRVDKMKRALQTEPSHPIRPVTRDLSVSLRPGAEPPVVRVASQQITYLNLIDSAGNPWPIKENGVILPPKACVDSEAEAGDSSVALSATTSYGTCSIGLRLEGLATPVTIQVVAGQGVVDNRLDLRFPGRHGGSTPIGIPLETLYDTSLQQLLDLGETKGAVALKTSAPREVEAWLLDGKRLIVRTRPGVLVTGFKSRYPGADGSAVYDLTPTPVVMVRAEGSGVMRPIEIVNLPPQ